MRGGEGVGILIGIIFKIIKNNKKNKGEKTIPLLLSSYNFIRYISKMGNQKLIFIAQR